MKFFLTSGLSSLALGLALLAVIHGQSYWCLIAAGLFSVLMYFIQFHSKIGE